jgi:hypothetical protein
MRHIAVALRTLAFVAIVIGLTSPAVTVAREECWYCARCSGPEACCPEGSRYETCQPNGINLAGKAVCTITECGDPGDEECVDEDDQPADCDGPFIE